MNKQLILDVHEKLIVDLFAGGGGTSTGFELALNRSPDIAINHNEDALSMHRANHPQTRHFIADVYEVCPRGATQGRPVGWLHLSPDCTHHSQAAGGQPRSKKTRGLSWVGYRWGGQVCPDVISLENVPQILQWGPLIAKRDKATGRVIKLDKTVAAPGERVPVQQQFLIPDPKRKGQTWKQFIKALKGLGYEVEWDISIAADLGGHTSRKRLFMIARRDHQPIVMPRQTHFKNPVDGKPKWKMAADCIDFSIPCTSIFGRKKSLAEATLRRIAKGIQKYVLNNADPFIVPIAHYNGQEAIHSIKEPMRTVTAYPKGGSFALASPIVVPATHQGSDRVHSITEPLRTITAANRGEIMLSSPLLAKFRGDSAGSACDEPMPTITSGGDSARPAGAPHALGLIAPTLVQTGYGEREGQAPRVMDIEYPLGTIVGTGKHAVSAAYLAQMNGGFNETSGHDMRSPVTTITNTGSQQQLVSAHLATLRRNCVGCSAKEPLPTLTSGGNHHAAVSAFLTSYYTDQSNRCRDVRDSAATITTENRLGLVECTLAPEHEAGALKVAAFLMRYYGEGGQLGGLRNPMQTITTKDRLALVTVMVRGIPYVIVDIGLRMLQPRELFRAQDFPDHYIIERGHDGRKFSKSTQVRMVGNSVDPIQAMAYIKANATGLAAYRRAA